MKQKTYEVTNKSQLEALSEDLDFCRLYEEANTVVAVIFASRCTEEVADSSAQVLREMFPKVQTVGMSLYGTTTLNAIRYMRVSFLFLDHSNAQVYEYDMEEEDEDVCVEALRHAIESTPYVKGVMLIPYGQTLDLSDIVERLQEGNKSVPFFGATASSNLQDYMNSIQPYVFGTKFIRNGVVAVVFSGEDLHIYADYRLGWKALGHEMSAHVDKDAPRVIGDTQLVKLDEYPAAQVFQRYLGVPIDENLFENIAEFPLVVQRNGLPLVRIPFFVGQEHELYFYGSFEEGEKVRLGYGNPTALLKESETGVRHMRYFQPEALLLYVCVSRYTLLKDREEEELDGYRLACPALTFCQGAGEIYKYEGFGGLANGSLVAVGMREGEKQGASQRPAFIHGEGENDPIEIALKSRYKERKAIPFEDRLINFLERTTNELNEMAREAATANAAKSTFLSNMSHEIRTPINAVLGMDEMILREAVDPQVIQYAEDIQGAGRTLLSLVNDILDFSKIESGKLELVPADFDFRDMISDVVIMTKKRAEDKGLTFHIEIDPRIPSIMRGDTARLKQEAINIITNAIKYTPEGSVTIRIIMTGRDQDHATIRTMIADTGMGMKEEDLPKLLNPFVRLDESRTRNIEGTGLGMNITAQLLRLMHSSLSVESTYDVGSIFSYTLELPIVDETPIGRYVEVVRSGQGQSRQYHESFHAPTAHVLAVDDAPLNLSVFRGLLKGTQARIDTASSGQEALELAQANTYDVIYLDQRMPEMDGVETLHRLRELPIEYCRKIPVICLTANAITGMREQAMQEGFTDYITKPVNPHQLEESLKNYLPKDKVVPVEHEAEETVDSHEEAYVERKTDMEEFREIPEWLFGVDDLDIFEGSLNCGGVSTFLETLQIYYSTIETNLHYMLDCLARGDYENFTIKVHAQKSTSRLVGLARIGKLSAMLEKAGDDGNRAFIDERIEEYARLLRQLKENLSPIEYGVHAENAPYDDTDAWKRADPEPEKVLKPTIETAMLMDAYATIGELAENLDFENMEYVLQMLGNYTIPAPDDAKIQAIREAVNQIDWDKVQEILKM